MQHAEMSEPHHRLRQARVQAGYKSAAEAARRLAMPYGTYSGHENGNRGFKTEDFVRYSRVFNVSISWLIDGIGDPEPKASIANIFVRMIGNVGSLPNGEVELSLPEKNHYVIRMDYFPEDAAVVRVSGPMVRNFVRPGWHLVCEDTFYIIEARHEGEICFCRTDQGKIFLVRVIRLNNDGTCDVEDSNGEFLYNRNFVGAAVVGLILPKVAVDGMYDVMEANGKKLKMMSEEMERTGQQTMSLTVDVSENRLRWGRTAASREIGS